MQNLRAALTKEANVPNLKPIREATPQVQFSSIFAANSIIIPISWYLNGLTLRCVV